MKKKILSLSLSLMIAFSGSICVFGADNKYDTTKITIIHTNDTHGRALSEDRGFGFAKIAAIAKETKKENPNTLLVDAGDTLHGMPIINISKGENAVKILDTAGYDFMVPGNHDFNYGQDRLLELSNMAQNFKILSSNIEKNNKDLFQAYEIVEMGNIKIGIFGLTTPDTIYKTDPRNIEGINFADPIEKSKEIVKELEDKTDVIVALAHMGLEESSTVTSKEVAENVDGIDVIIDGHSHTKLQNGLIVNNTLIAQTGEYDQNLGIVEIDVKDKKVIKKTAKLLDAKDYTNVQEDEKVKKVIDDIKTSNDNVFSEVVASTNELLDGERENVRTKETNLGDLATDAIRNKTKADIAFLNGGALRTSIEPGNITKGKLAEVFPFGNTVKVIKISGNDVIKALEVSVDSYPESKGGFLQVSGVKFSFDPSKEVGKKVSDVKVGDVPIDLSKEYIVAVNDYLAQGGDGYDMFKSNVIAEYETCDDIFTEYLNINGVKGSNIAGRISVKQSKQENVNNQVTETKQTVTKMPDKTETIYTVAYGDTLIKIARENNTTWKALADYNKINNPNLIFVGDKIKIPS